MLKQALTVGTTFVLACAVAYGETPTIVDITPETTMGVMHVPNAKQTLERLKSTRLWDLWQSDAMAKFRTDMLEDMDESMATVLEKFEMEEEDIVWPTGALGMSAYTTRDEEMGVLTFGVLATADYGADAGKAQEWLDKAIELAEKDGEIEYETREVLGRTVHCIEVVREDEQFQNQPGPGGGMGMGDPESMMADATDEMFIVREGSIFLVSTQMSALTGALEVHDAGEPGPGAAREKIREMMAGVGSDAGEHDVYSAVIFRDIGQLVSANDPMGMTMMIFPMVKQVLGDIQAMASASRFDGETAMIENTSKLYMPMGKAGLTALMNDSSPRGDVPAFVGPDAISYTAGNFRFKGLADALQPVFQMMQMMMGPQQQGQPMLSDIVRQATSALGDRFWMAQSVSRPLAADSMRQVMAIACENPRELENFVSEFGAGMGLEGRDFLGHRIYTGEMGGMMPMGGPGMGPSEPMAIGFGGPVVFMGPTSSVEQSLRSVGQSDAATLADEPAFKRGMAALSKADGVAWGWSDLVTTVEVQSAIAELQMEQFMEELGEEDPEFVEELAGMGLDDESPFADFDWDVLRQYVGPTVWELLPVDDGFVHKSFVLDAE